MPVKARQGGTGRVRTGRVGAQQGGGSSPGSPTGDPGNAAFQADFTALSALPTGISFSRASNAMMFDSTGKLTYAPNNLALNSEAFGSWTVAGSASVTSNTTLAPDGTTTADTLANTSAFNGVSQSISSTGARIIFSAYFLKTSGATSFPGFSIQVAAIYASVAINTDTGVATARTGEAPAAITVTSVGNYWRVGIKSTTVSDGTIAAIIYPAVNTDASATWTGGNGSTVIWGAQVEAVTYETSPRTYNPTTASVYYGPRFDYAWNGSAWVPKGLLIEEQRTNLALDSNNFNGPNWGQASVTNVAGAITSPDGTNNGWSVTANATIGLAQNYQAITTVAGNPYCFELFMRAGTSSWMWIGTPNQNYFNLTTGALGTISAGSIGSIQSIGNGWYRIVLFVANLVGTLNYLQFGPCDADGSTSVTSGKSIYAFGGQVEAATFATSYIPTTSAAVTRSADIVQLTGTALTTLQASAASILIENDTYAGSAEFQYVLGFNPVGGPGITYLGATVGQWNGTANLSGDTSTRGTIDRVGLAFDGSGRSFVSHGGTVASDAGSPAGAAITVVNLGSNNAVNQLDGHFRSIAIYSSRLSDADLQTKSVVGAAF